MGMECCPLEIDVHDKALGQGKYYTGHENMKDSATTYPD